MSSSDKRKSSSSSKSKKHTKKTRNGKNNKKKNRTSYNAESLMSDADITRMENDKTLFKGYEGQKGFDDYDPKRDTRKYTVYRNDIKYKRFKLINPKRAEWESEKIKDDFHNKDTDGIDYRIEDCIREKGQTLDLSNMRKDCFDKLFKHEKFNDLKGDIIHIFASDSNIRSIDQDLRILTKLQTLDLSNNSLKKLPKLPRTITELIVKNNKLIELSQDLPLLERLHCNNNKITEIKYTRTLQNLSIRENPIEDIPDLPCVYFLDVSITKVKKLGYYPSLVHFECEYTQIKVIPRMPSIKRLICSHSSVKDISKIRTLDVCEMIDCDIPCLPYMEDLFRIRFSKKKMPKFHRKFKITNVKMNKNNIIDVEFMVKRFQKEDSK